MNTGGCCAASLTVIFNDSPESLVLQDACRRDLLVFSRAMFKSRKGYRWILGRQHQIIADALMRVVWG